MACKLLVACKLLPGASAVPSAGGTMQSVSSWVITTLLVPLAGSFAAPTARGAVQRRPAPVRYTITDIGPLDPEQDGWTVGLAINDQGAVAGYGVTPGYPCDELWCEDSHAFIARGGTIVDLALSPDFGPCSAVDLNEAHQVVGSALPGSGWKSYAVLWDRGSMITLPDFGQHAWAVSINDAGVIVGAAVDGRGDDRPVAWREGRLVDLGTLPGGAAGYAGDINSFGTVAGASRDELGVPQPVVWVGGEIRKLEILDPNHAWGEADALNDSGRVVGASAYWHDDFGATQIAALWDEGAVQSLGFLNGPMSRAYDINEQGQVVGQSDHIGDFTGRAFLWEDGTMYDLNHAIDPSLGWILYSAQGINEDGSIVGTGQCPCGSFRGYLLTPIVESQLRR